METIGVVTRDWRLVGGLERWRQTTGVLRAHLAVTPLFAWLRPADVPRLLELAETAAFRDAVAEVQLGYADRRVPLRIELSRWTSGLAAIHVRALKPLPLSAWWVDDRTFAGLPAMPSTRTVWA